MPGSTNEAFDGFAEDGVDLDNIMPAAGGGGSPPAAADAEQYRLTIGDWTEKGTITLEDWTEKEPKPAQWRGYLGPEPAWFKTGKRKVVTGATYTGSTLPEGVSFAFVKLVSITFTGSTFEGKAVFTGATFDSVTFTQSTFEGNAVFNASAGSMLKFNLVNFLGDADFSGVTFTGLADYQNARFAGAVDFYKATFSDGAFFFYVEFTGKANFQGAKFSGMTFFMYATFSDEVKFDLGAEFLGGVSFMMADLGINCNMDRIEFHDGVFIDTNTNLSKVKNIETAVFGKLKVGTFETFRSGAESDAPDKAADADADATTDGSSDGGGGSKLDGQAKVEAPAGSSAAAATDGYDTIVDMPLTQSLVLRQQYLAMCVDSIRMANHKRELEYCIAELRGFRDFVVTKENWRGFLAKIESLYEYLHSLLQHNGNCKLVQILGEILFSDKPAAPQAASPGPSVPSFNQWLTPRKTFLTMNMIKDGFSKAPPLPGTLAAMESGIKAPFRRPEFLEQLNELNTELGYIAAITVSKERVGLLMQQISLSFLFGVSSFLATYIYENIDWIGNSTFVDDGDDDVYSPIVDALQSESDDSLALQQQLINQQQIIQLLGALLNATDAGN